MEPIFVKSLTRTDIHIRLALPSKFLECFPPLSTGDKHMLDFQVRDECGRVWKFRIYTRKRMKYLKPVLTKEWRDFVRSRQLCVGDRVAFYMDKEEGHSVEYRIRVEKEVKTCAVSGSTPARAAMDSEAKKSANEEVRRMEMKMEAMENHIATMNSNMEKFLHKIHGSSNILCSEQTNMIREQEAKKQNTNPKCSDEPDDTLCQVMGEEKGDCVETFGLCPDRAGVFDSGADEEVRQMVVKMEEKYCLMENHMSTMNSNMEKFLHNNGGSSNLFSRVLGRLKFPFWSG